MERNNNINLYKRELLELTRRSNNIKVMLWAGDLYAARNEIRSIRIDFGEIIYKSLHVGDDVIVTIRGNKDEVREKYTYDTTRKWETEHLIRQQLATLSSAENDEQSSLFVVSPIARLIRRLDRRISEETRQQEVFDGTYQLSMDLSPAQDLVQAESANFHYPSGFRYSRFGSDEGVWELRAYHLEPPKINIRSLLAYLEAQLAASPEIFETEHVSNLPISIRIFLDVAFIVIRMFEPGRLQVNLTVRHGSDIERIFVSILDAIAKSQEHPSHSTEE